jgi:Ca2+-binding RTX toxin-like protein
MALQIIGANSIGTGIRFFLTTNDEIIVSPGVTIGSTDLVGIFGTASGNYANVQGLVSGASAGLALGGNAATDMNNTLLVGETGYLAGFQAGAAFAGSNAKVENHGTIWSALTGLSLTGWSLATDTSVENDGLIQGSTAIHRSGAEAITIENAGVLKGSDWAYSTDNATAKDVIINTGRIEGKIWLAGGDDVYDGHDGMLSGQIFAGDGDDVVTGGADDDFFFGGLDDDVLRGNGGDDTLDGGGGNDVLVGGSGADLLFGGIGDDTYEVDGADQVSEAAGAGIDLVKSSVSYALGANVENLTLLAGAANGTGNTLANVITGNAAANILDGQAGADTMLGLGGNDRYVVDNAADIVNESGGDGIDTVLSAISFSLVPEVPLIGNVENLTLTGGAAINGTGNSLANILIGNAGANVLSGGAGNDTISGGAGNDTISGGLGNDRLSGGAGLDKFVFNTKPSASNRDVVTDFNHVQDTFQLDNAVFTKLGANGGLKAGFFHLGTAAADADDRIIYNKATGALIYDVNGSAAGGAVQFATLLNKPALQANDFVVI